MAIRFVLVTAVRTDIFHRHVKSICWNTIFTSFVGCQVGKTYRYPKICPGWAFPSGNAQHGGLPCKSRRGPRGSRICPDTVRIESGDDHAHLRFIFHLLILYSGFQFKYSSMFPAQSKNCWVPIQKVAFRHLMYSATLNVVLVLPPDGETNEVQSIGACRSTARRVQLGVRWVLSPPRVVANNTTKFSTEGGSLH